MVVPRLVGRQTERCNWPVHGQCRDRAQCKTQQKHGARSPTLQSIPHFPEWPASSSYLGTCANPQSTDLCTQQVHCPWIRRPSFCSVFWKQWLVWPMAWETRREHWKDCPALMKLLTPKQMDFSLDGKAGDLLPCANYKFSSWNRAKRRRLPCSHQCFDSSSAAIWLPLAPQATSGPLFHNHWLLRLGSWTSLGAQWLRIHLPMQGTQVQFLVWEDSTWCRKTKPLCHNYWSLCALEPMVCNKRPES